MNKEIHPEIETENPRISIIILNYNGRSMLRDCLNSVVKTLYSNFEVIVVDNGSTDGSRVMVQKEFPNVRLLNLPHNVGYSRGNNIGILQSTGAFIVLLNNDTIVSSQWLSELIRAAKKNRDCFYQPKILFINTKRINSVGNRIQLFGFAFPEGIAELDVGQHERTCSVSYTSGACVFAPRQLIDNVGLLDESDLFTFYEDVNWGWRGLLQGYTSVFVPSAQIYHRWGGSWGRIMSPKKFFLLERSRLATILRNYSFQTLIAILPALVLVEFSVLLYCFLKGFLSQKIRVYSDLIIYRNVLAIQRKNIQTLRKSSDVYVSNHFSNGMMHVYLGAFAIPINKVMNFLAKISRTLIR